MSSYISTQIDVEEQRLQGILQKCQEELLEAEAALNRHQSDAQCREEQRREQRRQYRAKAEDAQRSFLRAQRERQVRRGEKKREILQMILDARTEVSMILSGADRKNLLDELDGFRYSVEDEKADFGQIEEAVRRLVRKAEHNDREAVWYEGYASKDRPMFSVTGEKPVSLQMHREAAGRRERSRPQEPGFAEKLERAMALPEELRTNELKALEAEFHRQPAYAKTAFAVRNMQRLDRILESIRKRKRQLQSRNKENHQLERQYRALCHLLGEQEQESLLRSSDTVPALRRRCQEMRARFQEQRKRQYIVDAVRTVMERHQIPFTESRGRAGVEEMVFGMDAAANVSVSGLEYQELVMEVRGVCESRTPTLDERRKSADAARHFCSLAKQIETELQTEYGITFSQKRVQPPDAESIVMEQRGHSAREENRRALRRNQVDAM